MDGHTQRVTELTLKLAFAFSLPDEYLLHIRRGALLHDIGKMGVPDNLLLKPGALTEEEWDGTGYPRGLKGEEIPLVARFFTVVDVWDALRSDRAYRPAWTKKETLEYIKSLSGQNFDPKAVEYFLELIKE